MNEQLSAYLSSPSSLQLGDIDQLVAALRRGVGDSPAEAAEIIRRLVHPDLDYSAADALARIVKKLPAAHRPRVRKKLAILGGFTTHQLADLIELFLFAAGIDIEIYESDFGVYKQEILDPTSGLHAFEPDFVFLAVNRRNLGRWPHFADDAPRVRELVEAEVAEWSSLWDAAHRGMGCAIIQNNFDPPPWRILGNHEMRHPAGMARFVGRINDAMQDAAPAFVTIHDVDHLAASAGRWNWGDERFYYHAKLPCSPQHLVAYAHNVASVLAAQVGHVKKCLVLDLDNTLWGGVIGDDGIGKIRIGQGEAESEAFLAFQQYLLSLRHRGVILAVCSKNEHGIASEVFEKHAEMAIRLADISCFVANWQNKASNIRRIAEELNIGLNSMVLVDDNPAERALVRQFLPEVAVPELPEDPAGYIHAVERHAYFQTVSVGAEDLQRTDMYRANALRRDAENAGGDLDSFLRSLEMKARVEPVNDANIERVVQLVGRSNQFNLTTRRHSGPAVLAMAASGDCITRTISLRDRFGDNGLISVLLARIVESDLVIDTWLMSCRVLKRGVEQFLLNGLCDAARQRGLSAIVGEYVPTAKNELVRNHYADLGFQKVSAEPDGHTFWRLPVNDAPVLRCFIRESDLNEYSS